MRQGRATPRDAVNLRRGGVRFAHSPLAASLASPRVLVHRPARLLARRWPRVALLGVVLAVAFGVLSMHDLVRPMPAEHLMASASLVASDHAHGLAADAGTAITDVKTTGAALSGGVTSNAVGVNSRASHAGVSDVATVSVPGAPPGADGTDGCASCGHHPTAMALCILALSLLLLVWRVPPLRPRLAPPTTVSYVPSWVPAPRQPRPLSQAELSVCRT